MNYMSSFHGVKFTSTPQKLIDLADKLGAWCDEYNTGEDKTNFDFSFMTDEGTPFFVYDWKEYRQLHLDEVVEWHIGTENTIESIEARDYIATQLKSI